MKAISERLRYVEQIRIAVDISDKDAHAKAAKRIAELMKKGYEIVHVEQDAEEMNTFLQEIEKEPGI
jgi:urease gamma subunit